MVATSLNVERNEVHANTEGRLFCEETLRDLFREELVERLARLVDDSSQD